MHMTIMNLFGHVLSFICLIMKFGTGTSGNCPVGFVDSVNLTGTCFYFSGSSRTWYEARENCVSLGADLVRVDSSTVADVCKKILEDNGYEQYWHGLNDILQTDEYRWTNGDLLTWSAWGKYNQHVQPNDNNGDQACNIGDIDSNMVVPNTWQDKPCLESHPYICEYLQGDKTIRVGKYTLPGNAIINTANVEVTFITSALWRLSCAGHCLSESICDGYAYNRESFTCYLLKLKELSSSESTAVQTLLTGSDVYIRNGG